MPTRFFLWLWKKVVVFRCAKLLCPARCLVELISKQTLASYVIRSASQSGAFSLPDIVSAISDEIVEALRRGDRVELRGFGAFSAKLRGARQGRNPVLVPLSRSQRKPLPSSRRERRCARGLIGKPRRQTDTLTNKAYRSNKHRMGSAATRRTVALDRLAPRNPFRHSIYAQAC